MPLRDRTPPPGWSPAPRPAAGDRVVVGISGGVDSSVAALLLKQRGCEVVGVTTKNFCVGDSAFDLGDTSGSCCSEEATLRARALCDQLDISHTVLDVADLFRDEVISDYVREYHAGRTPSPCVLCNQNVRFPELLGFARKLGCDWVATGHYARRVVRGGATYVARAVDDTKDQSYYLSRVPAAALARVDFPLGDLSKREVRELAAQFDLPAAHTADSQELCFVPDGDRSRVLGPGRPGDIVDTTGRVVGRHEGIGFYTVGQRKGLKIGGASSPRFVVRIEAEHDRLVVGGEDELLSTSLGAVDCDLRDPERLAPGLTARTRARHEGVRVAAVVEEDGLLRARLAGSGDRAPAPGQTLVLYRDEVVVGAGRLVALPESELA